MHRSLRHCRVYLSLGLVLTAAGCASAPSPAVTPAPEAATSAAASEPRVLPGTTCNTRRSWVEGLSQEASAGADDVLSELDRAGVTVPEEKRAPLRKAVEGRLFWRTVRTLIVHGAQNNGAMIELESVRTRDGRPLKVYRTGMTPLPADKGSCFRSLVEQAGVRHVVNLYAGPMATGDLEKAERAVVDESGGSYFLARDADAELRMWRDLLREEPSPEDLASASATVARILNEHVLRPGGQAPRGHAHIHCGGGMHRTGMAMGLLDRCVNGAPTEKIVADYKRHVGWTSPEHPGGYEQGNVDFVLAFDCGLLRP